MANLVMDKLGIRTREWHANDTEMNHLQRNGLITNQKIGEGLERFFMAKTNNYNPLAVYGKTQGSTITMTSDYQEWELMGASDRPLVILENLDATLTKPGQGKTVFSIKLDANWWKIGDVIAPANKIYLLRIQSMPRPSGRGYIYDVVLHENNPQLFVPTEFLKPGAKWAKQFSIYGEGADAAGSVNFAAPFTLKTRGWRMRKEYKVTGDVKKKGVLDVAMMDRNNKIHKSNWVSYAEAEFMIQYDREKEWSRWYMREGATTDTTGRQARSGPGIEQLMEAGHLHFYNKLTTKLLEEYLMDIFYGRVGFKSRHVVAYTGEYGALNVHNALQNTAFQRVQITTDSDKFVSKTASEFSSAALQYGYQFVRYVGPNGIILDIMHNACYDDVERHWAIDPISGKPAESQKITFMDFQEGSGGKNLFLLENPALSSYGYVAGTTSPYGPQKGGLMSHKEDSYTVVRQDEMGVLLKDVSRCGQLRLASQR